jgi:hypothetical protein
MFKTHVVTLKVNEVKYLRTEDYFSPCMGQQPSRTEMVRKLFNDTVSIVEIM